MKSVTQNIRGVTGKHCLSKGILSQQRYRHQAVTEYIFRVRNRHHQLLFRFFSNRICYRWILKSRTKDAWDLHAALRTVFENHCLTNNTWPASCDVKALAIIKTKKHHRLADPLSQACRSTVWCRNS